jgi:pyruvate dehydrogenase E2 component (dihydrolipoamide acetyltransferase)
MGEFLMPSLGADMEVGTILEWRVKPGDTVHRGDIVAVVDTEKSDIEVEVFEDGVIAELLVEPGVEVPVGTPLARITPHAVTAPTPAPQRAAPAEEPTPKRRAPRRRAPTRAEPAFVRASPLARRHAADRGLDLGQLAGSGPGGAVLAADVVPARHPSPEAARPARRQRDQQAMRNAIAERMARAKRDIPHYYLGTTIDLSSALGWLGDRNAARPVTERLLPAALLLKATARAAREVPTMNGIWQGGFQPADHVHLGVAVALRGGGLIAPAIRDADRLDLDALMQELRGLVQRTRAGALRSGDVAEATITVTNLGDLGVEEVYGIIYPPQVALVGFGAVAERPWAVAGMLGVRPTVRATLSADHRASDGHDGAAFLASIDRLLQHPEDL